ncbi:MAG: hypothetical protein RL307_223 [Pseudomonadota bacterium]|jgi:hypothetical protein
MKPWLTWGEAKCAAIHDAVWPGRWGRVIPATDINLLPWRRFRQGLEWAAWLLGLMLGAGLGLLVAHVHQQYRQADATQWQQHGEVLRQQLHEAQTHIAHWQQRWAWQLEREAWQAWRGEAFRGLMQPLQAPKGEVLFRAMSWDGRQAQAEIWVVHPELAAEWLETHWTPYSQSGYTSPNAIASPSSNPSSNPSGRSNSRPPAQWRTAGEWQALRKEAGEVGAIGATVWANRWQSQPSLKSKASS